MASRRVKKRIGLGHDSANDFDHSPKALLSTALAYIIFFPCWRAAA